MAFFDCDLLGGRRNQESAQYSNISSSLPSLVSLEDMKSFFRTNKLTMAETSAAPVEFDTMYINYNAAFLEWPFSFTIKAGTYQANQSYNNNTNYYVRLIRIDNTNDQLTKAFPTFTSLSAGDPLQVFYPLYSSGSNSGTCTLFIVKYNASTAYVCCSLANNAGSSGTVTLSQNIYVRTAPMAAILKSNADIVFD